LIWQDHTAQQARYCVERWQRRAMWIVAQLLPQTEFAEHILKEGAGFCSVAPADVGWSSIPRLMVTAPMSRTHPVMAELMYCLPCHVDHAD